MTSIPSRGHEVDPDDLVAWPAQAKPARAAGVGGEDASKRRPVGLRDIDQQPLVLLGQNRVQRGRRDPGLHRDRHVGVRIVDDPAERPGVDRDSGAAGYSPIVERGGAALGIDGKAITCVLANGLAEVNNGLGPEPGQRQTAIAQRPRGRRIGPGWLCSLVHDGFSAARLSWAW